MLLDLLGKYTKNDELLNLSCKNMQIDIDNTLKSYYTIDTFSK